MLVLSRKESQRIKVGDSIVVTVVRLSGDKVRLGIEAPRDMVVLREELDLASSPVVDEPMVAVLRKVDSSGYACVPCPRLCVGMGGRSALDELLMPTHSP
jgi:carbon storage regulator